MPFPFGHSPIFPVTESFLKKFCPKCNHEREWRYEGDFKICQTCGLRVKLTNPKKKEDTGPAAKN